MRVLAIAIVLTAGGVARADWDEVVPIERRGNDAGRSAVGVLVGAGIGDGGARDTSAGARGWFQIDHDVGVGAELRDVTAAGGSRRTAAASIDLGYRIARGTLTGEPHVFPLALIATAGAGAVWTDTTTAADRAHAALTVGLAARVHLSEDTVLEVGVHDDVYRGGDLLEVRASLSWMLGCGDAGCTYVEHHPGRRNPLDGQPAI
jgi:hypothetical protein